MKLVFFNWLDSVTLNQSYISQDVAILTKKGKIALTNLNIYIQKQDDKS